MNQSTRGQWQLYAPHRRHIERLIQPSQPGLRICVLGAGNCNDLDLAWMIQVFGEVHLVDIDSTSLKHAVRRQKCESSGKLHLHAPVDLSGIADVAGKWKSAPPTQADIDRSINAISSSPGLTSKSLDAESFDVVLSPCVLSQILVFVRDAIGSDHPAYPRLRSALWAAHLRLMIELLKLRGRGVLLLDVTSTEHFPDLARVRDEDIPDVTGNLIARGKCFKALTPHAILSAIREDPIIFNSIEAPQFTQPWLWHLGLNKAFAVYGTCFSRRRGHLDDHVNRPIPKTDQFHIS